MAIPVQDQRVRPLAAWYVVPVVLWIAAVALFVVAVVAIAQVVNEGVDATRNNASIDIPANGLTVYSTDRASTADCVLVGNGESRSLDSLNVTIEINVSGPSYYGLGVTPDSLSGGTYRLQCSGLGPDTRLGLGPRVDVTALATRALWGIFLPMALGVIGLVVLIVLIVKRHSSRSRIKSAQSYESTRYRGGWGQPSPDDRPPPPPPPSP